MNNKIIVSLENICKSYGDNAIINDFNLSISENEMIMITGPSGSGKSTLLNIIGCLENVDSGKVTLFGQQNIKPNSKKARVLLRDKISYLFQNYALIDSDTVEENLKIATNSKNRTEKIKLALEKVGLSGFEKKYIYQLSGGEQQRIALARIIVKDSELILADEPTGNLDDKNAFYIMDILEKMKGEGKTLIMVSHDQRFTKKFNKVIKLRKENDTK